MKKLIFSAALILSLTALTACSDTEKEKVPTNDETSTGKEEASKTINNNDLAKLYTSPKDFKGAKYDFVGKVFITPEKDDDGVYLQVYANPKDMEYNTIVAYNDPNFEVSDGDYVKVKGIIREEFKGENMMGGEVIVPVVEASSLEVLDYVDAVAPTIATLSTGETIDQSGFVATIEKVEFAELHTRVYVSVTNNTDDNISFYSHNLKIVSNGTQFEEEVDYEANLPELQSNVLPGVTTSGVVTFPAMDSSITELQIHAEGYSENYEINIEPFTFNITK